MNDPDSNDKPLDGDMWFAEADTMVRERFPRILAISAIIGAMALVGMIAVSYYDVPAPIAFIFGMAATVVIEPLIDRLRTWDRGL